MDPFKKVVGMPQDWSDPQKAIEEIERIRERRERLEQPDPERDAWILERLKRTSDEDA